jgi:hypothetical protein
MVQNRRDTRRHGDEAKGKKMGRTKADFFKAEQKALEPFQCGLFDDLIV